MEKIDMGPGEAMTNSVIQMKLTFAEGAVDPEPRIAAGEIKSERIDELEDRIKNGEFRSQADPKAIPCDCMDCRLQANGQAVVGVKAAGGTMTVVMQDALTTASYRHEDEKAPEHKRRIYRELKNAGHEVGGHIGVDGAPGCGAEVKLDNKDPNLPSILRFMQRKGADIFGAIRMLGQDVSAELEDGITAKAGQLQAENYATSGEELAQVGLEIAPDNVRQLANQQKGVLVAILTQPGEILDQQAISNEYGEEGLEVFEIAAWAIDNSAKATSTDPAEAHAKLIAGLAYNLGAGGVIGGPGMRVIVL